MVKLIKSDFNGNVTESSLQLPDLENRSMHDEVVLGYKKRSAAGEIFNNPFNSSVVKFEAHDTYHGTVRDKVLDKMKHSTTTYQGGYLLSSLWPGFNFPAINLDTANAERNAKLQCLASVNKTEFDSGTFIAEWAKTKVLHREVGQALLKIFTEGAVHRKKKSSVKKIPLYDDLGRPRLNRQGKPIYRYQHTVSDTSDKLSSSRTEAVANAYLIGRFGIGPLIADMESAVKFLCSGSHVRQTARGREILTGSSTNTFGIGDDAGKKTHIVELRSQRTIDVRVGFLYETDPISRAVAQLGLTRPLSTMWELTPYSFVIDRFVKVGEWLDAVQPAGFVKPLAAWVSTTETLVRQATVSSVHHRQAGDYTFDCSWNGNALSTAVHKARSPWSDFTVPKLPTVGGDVTSMHAVDYAALVLQKLGLSRTFK